MRFTHHSITFKSNNLMKTIKDRYNDYKDHLGTNDIIIDCKQDSALPKDTLEENLQLLIDRIGVIELNKLVEGLVNSTGHPFDRHRNYTALDYLKSLGIMVSFTPTECIIGYATQPIGNMWQPTQFFQIDKERCRVTNTNMEGSKEEIILDTLTADLLNPFPEVDLNIIKSLLK